MRNSLRSPQYAILFTIGAIGSFTLACLGFFGLAALRGEALAANATLVTFAIVTMMWTVVPLLGFGTDETLDPQRLALLPLRPSQLLRGLLAAAFVGVAPVATAFALSGALVGLAHDIPSVCLIILAIALDLLFCVAASRTLIALLAPLLRSRRGRDLTVMAIMLAAFVPQSFRLFTSQHHDVHTVINEVATRVRFTPFGLGGLAASEAGNGHFAAAATALAALTILTGALLVVWARVIPRAMTTADAAGPARSTERDHRRRRPSLYPRAVPLPRSRAGAVAAKELRYYVRDPRRRAPLLTALIVPALFLFSTLRDGQHRPAATTLLALVALLPASGLTLNQFGLDGAALWSTIVAGNDARSDLTGKNLATTIVVFPLVAVPAFVTAAITRGWAYLPLTMGLAPALLGVVLGTGNVVSAWAPYAIPDRLNPLASNPGQGCVGGLAALGALFFNAILLFPLGIFVAAALMSFPLAVATVASITLAALYGYTGWIIGRALAARRLTGRMPELLDAVSPRQAA